MSAGGDIDDLLGPAPAKKGRPTLAEAVQKRDEREATPPKAKLLTFEDMRQGVSVAWLSAAFRLDSNTCRRRLLGCPKVGVTHGNTPLYDFVEAASYLVKPKFDLKTMKAKDLPPELQDTVWAARLKQQKWEEKAGQLWRTSAVLTVLGDAFMLIKNTMQLWTEDARLARTLTDDQRAALIEMVDGLQKDLHTELVGMAQAKATRSQLAELEAEEGGEAADEEDLI